MGQFTLAIDSFVADTKKKIDLACLDLTLHVGERLVILSPVDTGHFRSNWRFSMDAPDLSVTDAGGTSENPTPPPAPPSFRGPVAGRIAYWTNSVPYGPALERGHSAQAPLGMVRITAMEFPAMVEEAGGRARVLKGAIT